jgi:hypothetical protein
MIYVVVDLSMPFGTSPYWKPVSDSNGQYAQFMVQLTRSIIRIHLGHPFNFAFSLSSKQTDCLKRLIAALQDSNSSGCRGMIAYHNWV